MRTEEETRARLESMGHAKELIHAANPGEDALKLYDLAIKIRSEELRWVLNEEE